MSSIFIAGAGVMGSSLAQVYALGGYDTILYNRSESGIERSKHMINLNQETLIAEEIISSEDSRKALGKIKFTTDLKDCSDCDVVLETVKEDLSVKHEFWKEVSKLVSDKALLATNTSGLHISDIALAVKDPSRFIGQHWLNPPHLLPLCELVVGEKTSSETVEKMREIVLGLGKKPVVVKDINGFIINRIQFAVLREALHIVESGAASFEDVDTVLQAGMGLRYAALGPFGVADFGGLDTFAHINEYLNAELCDSKVGSEILRAKVASGELGVKSGKGFYDYSGEKADKAIKERDRLYIDLAKTLYFTTPRNLKNGENYEK